MTHLRLFFPPHTQHPGVFIFSLREVGRLVGSVGTGEAWCSSLMVDDSDGRQRAVNFLTPPRQPLFKSQIPRFKSRCWMGKCWSEGENAPLLCKI